MAKETFIDKLGLLGYDHSVDVGHQLLEENVTPWQSDYHFWVYQVDTALDEELLLLIQD